MERNNLTQKELYASRMILTLILVSVAQFFLYSNTTATTRFITAGLWAIMFFALALLIEYHERQKFFTLHEDPLKTKFFAIFQIYELVILVVAIITGYYGMNYCGVDCFIPVIAIISLLVSFVLTVGITITAIKFIKNRYSITTFTEVALFIMVSCLPLIAMILFFRSV